VTLFIGRDNQRRRLSFSEATPEFIEFQAFEVDLATQPRLREQGLVIGHEAVVERPEAALIRRALHCDRGIRRVLAKHRKVLEDVTRQSWRDELFQNQRLNLSRELLTERSSEVSVVTDLHRRVRIAQDIPF